MWGTVICQPHVIHEFNVAPSFSQKGLFSNQYDYVAKEDNKTNLNFYPTNLTVNTVKVRAQFATSRSPQKTTAGISLGWF